MQWKFILFCWCFDFCLIFSFYYIYLVLWFFSAWKSDFKMAWQKRETTYCWNYNIFVRLLSVATVQKLQHLSVSGMHIYLYYIVAIWNDLLYVILYKTFNLTLHLQTENPCCVNSFIKLINKGKIRLVL